MRTTKESLRHSWSDSSKSCQIQLLMRTAPIGSNNLDTSNKTTPESDKMSCCRLNRATLR